MWKPVQGYENRYNVSDDGCVVSLRSNRILSVQKNERNERIVYLTGDDKKQHCHTVANIVARAFIGDPPYERCRAEHINGDSSDDRADNIRWYVSPVSREPSEYAVYQFITYAKGIVYNSINFVDFRSMYIDKDDLAQEILLYIWQNLRYFNPAKHSFEWFVKQKVRKALYLFFKKNAHKVKTCRFGSNYAYATKERY